MLIFLMFVFGIIGAIIWVLTMYKKEINIIKLCSIGLGIALTLYTIISIILLYFDCFVVKSACVIELVILFAIIVGTLILGEKPNFKNIDWNIKEYTILLCILTVSLLMTAFKSVPIAPLFDAGVYGAKSIQLFAGEAKMAVELDEYRLIEEETVRKELIELQNYQAGIYPLSIDENSYVYEYHGLPTWPALMALSAAMFGLENMSLILSFLLVVLLSSLYFIMENMKVKKYARNLILTIFALSPLTLYLYKLPLSEGLITCFFAFTCFFLSEEEEKIKYLSIIGMAALCGSHISLFMYIPILFFCLMILFLYKQNRVYAVVNIFMNLELVLSLMYAYKTSNRYLSGNFGTRIDGIDTNMLLLLITIMAGIFICMQLGMCIIVNNRKNSIKIKTESTEKILSLFLKTILIIILLYTIYLAYEIGFTDNIEVGVGSWRFREQYINKGFQSILRLNIVNIALAVGWLALPTLIASFIKKRNMSMTQICINSIWIYSLAIYTFVRCDTPINYSASRYFIIVLIPALILGLASMVESKRILLIITIVAVLVGLPANYTLLTTKEYDGNIQFLQDVVSVVDKNASVLINLQDNTFISYNLITNLRELNNNYVFNFDSLEYIKEFADEGNQELYYVTTQEYDNEQFELVSEKSYPYIGELYSLDVVYPTEVGRASLRVYIYRYKKDETGEKNEINNSNTMLQ